MNETFRRVVTGLNDNGKSCVTIDGPPGKWIDEAAGGLFSLWQSENSVRPRERGDAAQNRLVLNPPEGGSRVMFFTLPPIPEDTPRDMLEAATAHAFEQIDATGNRVDTSRHPAMHQTDTIDYVVVLSGEVKLMLDEDIVELKPFDVVVQRATNHAWFAMNGKPALMAAILIDADVDRS
ncbi:MAG TPA: cupin domain-containing protein [Sphingomonadales bacterium]|nr:cupin domain-containing protein [Sphingomonadales bacterium]